MEELGDRVADTVHAVFDGLHPKLKPAKSTEGLVSWVPISGIVVSQGDVMKRKGRTKIPPIKQTNWECRSDGGNSLTCLALGSEYSVLNVSRFRYLSGMKCLPRAKIPQAAGCVLHDWHAEIIAMRAFNRFLLEECLFLAQNPGQAESSAFIRPRETFELSETTGFQPFTIREDVKIYMYCSEAPCGDASMELVMQAQDDPTPWPIDPLSLESKSGKALKGRSHFSVLGIVRRKPSRPDCPATLSKSCSDKLALKQCTSILGSLASTLISPSNAYIDSLVLPRPAYNKVACDRAFGTSGRLKLFADKIWRGGHRFSPFQVMTTQREFCSSRRSLSSPSHKPKASNISAVYTPRLQESLINGVLQGRKQFDPRGGSALCNSRLWKLYSQVANEIGLPSLQRMLRLKSYQQLKLSEQLRSRLEVKEEVRNTALQGWVPNDGDHLDLVLNQ